MEIKPGAIPLNTNYSPGRSKKIEYIVIHYTANKNDTAVNNIQYFSSSDTGTSAHFFVDSNDIYSSVPVTDTAWHCGAKTYYHPLCRNANSIGIEMCTSYNTAAQEYYISDGTEKNTVWLVKKLMKEFNIPIENIIRHYDVTHKNCPMPWVEESIKWSNFKEKLVSNEEEFDMNEVLNKITDIETAVFNIKEKLTSIDNIINTMGKEIYELQQQANADVYNKPDGSMPDWAVESITKLIDSGLLQGDAKGNLNLTYDMLRILVILERALNNSDK